MTTHEHMMDLNVRPNVRMTRGEGSYLWDHTGKRYLDFIQGWAVNCLGHCPEAVRRAVRVQLETVINVGPAHYNDPALSLCNALARLSNLERVCLMNSGCEVNDAAVKLARKWGQKHKQGAYEVITTHNSFHGRTLAMTCATGKPGFEDAFPPKIQGFPKVPYGDIEAMRGAVSDRTVAIMIEPIQGEAGAVTPPHGYVQAVRALCDERGILLILDEIQTGIGRTGTLFACEHEGVLPDIMTLGKGLGGGLPISALLAREDVSCFSRGDHGSTFGGNPVCASAALAVLATLTSESHRTQQAETSARLFACLSELQSELGAHVRGRGHLWALVLNEPRAEAIRDSAFANGLLINAARPNVLRFMPALNITHEEIDEMVERLRMSATT